MTVADIPYIDEKLQEKKDSVTPETRRPATGSRSASAGKAAVSVRKTASKAVGGKAEKEVGKQKRPVSSIASSKPNSAKPSPNVTSARVTNTAVKKAEPKKSEAQRSSPPKTSSTTPTATPTRSKIATAGKTVNPKPRPMSTPSTAGSYKPRTSSFRPRPISKPTGTTANSKSSPSSTTTSTPTKSKSAQSIKNPTPPEDKKSTKTTTTAHPSRGSIKNPDVLKEKKTNTSPRTTNASKCSTSFSKSISPNSPTKQTAQAKSETSSVTFESDSKMLGATFSRQQSVGDSMITFPDIINSRTDFDTLSRLLEATGLDSGDKQCLSDLREYVIKGEDSWILDTKLVNFIGALLEHRSLNPDIRAKLVRLLAAGALRGDFWSFLQMDRKDRHLMKFPQDFENLTVEEQKAVTLFLCNNFSSPKGIDWLFYTSTWRLDDNTEVSNIKITSKVASFSLVSYTPSLQDYGSAMIYNIAMKEAKALSVPSAQYNEEDLPSVQLEYGSVSDKEIMTSSANGVMADTTFVTLKVYNDIAAELSIAILKYLKRTETPPEEILFRCVKSLVKFSVILRADLMSCIAMVSVDLDTIIPGKSERVDQSWAQLREQLLASA